MANVNAIDASRLSEGRKKKFIKADVAEKLLKPQEEKKPRPASEIRTAFYGKGS